MALVKMKNDDKEKKHYIKISKEKGVIFNGPLIGVSEYLYYGNIAMLWLSPQLDYSLALFNNATLNGINSYTENGHCEIFE